MSIGMGMGLRANNNSGGLRASRPSLDLDFQQERYSMSLLSKAFGDIITFTRASAATRVNAQGLIESVAANVPRIDYDPVTLECKGLLVEEQRTNLLIFSSDFAYAGWNPSGIQAFGAGSVADAAIAPDGSMTADKICTSSTTVVHRLSLGTLVSNGQIYTASVYAKAGEIRYLGLKSGVAGADMPVFDLQTGQIVEGVGKITPAGNGWYLCSHTFVMNSGTHIAYWTLLKSPVFASESFAGIGGEGLYLWGAQLEAGPFPTSYIPTAGAQVTRAADVAMINSLSPWWNASEGTVVIDYKIQSQQNVGLLAVRGDGENNFHIWSAGENNAQFERWIGGAAVRPAVMTNIVPGAKNKIAISHSIAGSASCANGGVVTLAAGGAAQNFTNLRLFGNRWGSSLNNASGYVLGLRHYPKRLSDAQLQQITS